MKKITFLFLSLILILGACRPEQDSTNTNLEYITYAPSSYTVTPPNGFPAMEVPADNPMTVEGIKLGRHLFYDPILSRDSTISCSSCHQIDKAFTDGQQFSLGIEGRRARRNSMSLINIGYSQIKNRKHNFMWDGRFATLEEQALAPIEDPNEMDASWLDIEQRLRTHPDYPQLFREAFGISGTPDITKELAAKALAQFQRTLNSANSQYDADRWVAFEYMTPQQQRGFDLFLGDATGNPVAKDAECLHCHSFSNNQALFARNDFTNNGLDSVTSFNDFVDKGYGAVIGDPTKNGFFREVTVRNIALTAPYMHDGRFKTLREVLDHYATGGHAAPNLAPELTTSSSIQTLTESEKDDLEAFLNALTDTTIVNRTEWSNPFN
jgi:cytochrome c peroxidase